MAKVDLPQSIECPGSSAGVQAGQMLSSSLTLKSGAGKALYQWTKRGIDVVLALLLLALLSPVVLIVAIVIKCDSPGPVLFTQERMGYDWRRRQGRIFRFHKFRSMYHNCDQGIHEQHIKAWIHQGLGSDSGQPMLVKLTDDPRVTRSGRVLRKSSLDEIPQLINVLRGEMSLVGPRPVPLYEVAEYDTWHQGRLQATPGITGMWQVYGRGTVTLDEMVRLDILYIQQQSLWLDIKLMLLTIPTVIRGEGAA